MRIGFDAKLSPVLQDVEDFKQFKIVSSVARRDHALIGAALAKAGAGDLSTEDHAFISQSWLIDASGRGGDQTWREKLSAMLTFAAKQGWIRDPDGAVRAHIDWPPEA